MSINEGPFKRSPGAARRAGPAGRRRLAPGERRSHAPPANETDAPLKSQSDAAEGSLRQIIQIPRVIPVDDATLNKELGNDEKETVS
ncbi:hypothetical protein EVAR_99152_1 [Eumeta japonica]|uniref:Uncharacterized protein n=1 Tax=Eumeta variegata TaxID=151549 RepID=A0A4C1YC18_EUMVA|nr:hypothetical protein EVAR_99152_1 [Eumeta japonica]